MVIDLDCQKHMLERSQKIVTPNCFEQAMDVLQGVLVLLACRVVWAAFLWPSRFRLAPAR